MKKNYPYILFIIMMIFCSSGSFASEKSDLNVEYFRKVFKDRKGCFILYNMTDNKITRYNTEQCRKRLSPCSTFKIPNSLIALQAGVHKDENSGLKWDGKPKPVKEWERDHTLNSAFKESCVWFYQETAARVGEENMKKYLELLNYGNRDISGGLTKFWLRSSLLISAEEQVEFLARLYRNQLPFDKSVMDIVRQMMVFSEHDETIISGKTGSAFTTDGKWTLGWYVGHMKKNGREYVFAVNIEGEDKCNGFIARNIALEILKTLPEAGN
jgi:beta-lactamase class D